MPVGIREFDFSCFLSESRLVHRALVLFGRRLYYAVRDSIPAAPSPTPSPWSHHEVRSEFEFENSSSCIHNWELIQGKNCFNYFFPVVYWFWKRSDCSRVVNYRKYFFIVSTFHLDVLSSDQFVFFKSLVLPRGDWFEFIADENYGLGNKSLVFLRKCVTNRVLSTRGRGSFRRAAIGQAEELLPLLQLLRGERRRGRDEVLLLGRWGRRDRGGLAGKLAGPSPDPGRLVFLHGDVREQLLHPEQDQLGDVAPVLLLGLSEQRQSAVVYLISHGKYNLIERARFRGKTKEKIRSFLKSVTQRSLQKLTY